MARAFLAVTVALLMGVAPAGAAEDVPESGSSRTLVFRVDGMTCGVCAAAVRRSLGKIDGVEGSEVDVDSGRAVVRALDHVTPDTLETAIESAGYQAELLEVR